VREEGGKSVRQSSHEKRRNTTKITTHLKIVKEKRLQHSKSITFLREKKKFRGGGDHSREKGKKGMKQELYQKEKGGRISEKKRGRKT